MEFALSFYSLLRRLTWNPRVEYLNVKISKRSVRGQGP
jgi:hypothetical protein